MTKINNESDQIIRRIPNGFCDSDQDTMSINEVNLMNIDKGDNVICKGKQGESPNYITENFSTKINCAGNFNCEDESMEETISTAQDIASDVINKVLDNVALVNTVLGKICVESSSSGQRSVLEFADSVQRVARLNVGPTSLIQSFFQTDNVNSSQGKQASLQGTALKK